MTRLNQLIAVRKGVVSTAEQAFTKAYQDVQKTALMVGITKQYQPSEEGGEQLAGERQIVQIRIPDVLNEVADALKGLFDIHATLDMTNQVARSAIFIDGHPITEMLPVATLLTIEKKLTDLSTFIKKLPLLDPAELWTADEHNEGVWRAEPIRTQRQKKVPRNHVKSEATDKHPAQVEVYHEDVIVGHWTTTKFSGALPLARAKELLARVNKLLAAVKQAREQANMVEVEDCKPGDAITRYLFG